MSKTCARSRHGVTGGRFRGLVATRFAESRLCTCGTAANDGGSLHRCVPLLASLVRGTVSCFWIEQEQCSESAARGLRHARPAWGRLMRKTNLREGAGYRTRTSTTTQLPGSLRRKKSIYCLGSRFVYGFERARAAEWRHKSRSRKVMIGPEPSDGPLIHTQNAISDILSRFSCRADSDHTGEPPVRASGCRCVPPCHCVAVLGCAPSEILLDRVPVPCVIVCVTT